MLRWAYDQRYAIFSSDVTSTLPGQVVNSTGGALTLKIFRHELSSRATTEWLEELAWEVGCVDCDPVLANFSVEQDCENDQFFVEVGIFNMDPPQRSASLTMVVHRWSLRMHRARTPQAQSPIGTPVIVTAGNTLNAYCSAVSTEAAQWPLSCGELWS